jgi:hypothetical protein
MRDETKDPTIGTVASRECPLCGHHEIGFVTEDGEFHPLMPGTTIRVYEPPSPVERVRDKLEALVSAEKQEQVGHRLWIPEPLRGDRVLRLKYSVLLKSHLSQGEMSGGLYELAYVEKLEKLIDKVIDVPVPVILDRLFNAPYLASGNSRQIAEALYRELDEIQRPVVLMRSWLERGDDQSLVDLIAPKTLEKLGHEPASDTQIETELEKLTLEDFLKLL